ncbi:MAG TPA: DUF3618 domain-containing protein [Micromonosporaceae bacterium]|jgi:hypothetical protein|nr:DUF3618 domain-containing protein [Micromonosporaceae bacterium]
MNRAGPRDSATTDPDLIRREIARTRQELGLTVEALMARADVKARAREKVDDARRRVAALAGPASGVALLLALGLGVVMVVRLVRERRYR